MATPLESVLLVESDTDNRDMYAEWLTLAGFRVLTADNALDALSLAPRVEVIVTSMRLRGGMDGAELAEHVRADDGSKAILIVTASVFLDEEKRGQRAGADAVLAKPCLPHTLADEIRRVLTIKHAA